MKKIIFFAIFLTLFSCSASKIIEPEFIDTNNSNLVVPVLFEAWSGKKLSAIVERLGPPDNIKEENAKKIYTYHDPIIKDFDLLLVTADNGGNLLSILYLLTDENSKINRELMLSTYFKDDWYEVKLPMSDPHVVVQKMIILNEKKKTSAGYIKGYKDNKISYLYFDRDIEKFKGKDLFFWE